MPGRSERSSLDAPAMADDEHLPRCFLLFAGSQPAPQGGLGDLVGAFTSEVAAREAFRHLRLHQDSASSWAQLAIVERDRGIRALSWFGIGAKPARTPVTFPRPRPAKSIHTRTEGGAIQATTGNVRSSAEAGVEPTARHLTKRVAVCLASLVALAAITIGVVSDDGRPLPDTTHLVTVDGSDPGQRSVIPFPVDASSVVDGTSSADG